MLQLISTMPQSKALDHYYAVRRRNIEWIRALLATDDLDRLREILRQSELRCTEEFRRAGLPLPKLDN